MLILTGCLEKHLQILKTVLDSQSAQKLNNFMTIKPNRACFKNGIIPLIKYNKKKNYSEHFVIDKQTDEKIFEIYNNLNLPPEDKRNDLEKYYNTKKDKNFAKEEQKSLKAIEEAVKLAPEFFNKCGLHVAIKNKECLVNFNTPIKAKMDCFDFYKSSLVYYVLLNSKDFHKNNSKEDIADVESKAKMTFAEVLKVRVKAKSIKELVRGRIANDIDEIKAVKRVSKLTQDDLLKFNDQFYMSYANYNLISECITYKRFNLLKEVTEQINLKLSEKQIENIMSKGLKDKALITYFLNLHPNKLEFMKKFSGDYYFKKSIEIYLPIFLGHGLPVNFKAKSSAWSNPRNYLNRLEKLGTSRYISGLNVLMNNNLNPYTEKWFFDTFFEQFIESGNLDATKEVLKSKYSKKHKKEISKALYKAIDCDKPLEMVKLLLKHGAKRNIKSRYYNTPVHYARIKKLPAVAKLLQLKHL